MNLTELLWFWQFTKSPNAPDTDMRWEERTAGQPNLASNLEPTTCASQRFGKRSLKVNDILGDVNTMWALKAVCWCGSFHPAAMKLVVLALTLALVGRWLLSFKTLVISLKSTHCILMPFLNVLFHLIYIQQFPNFFLSESTCEPW